MTVASKRLRQVARRPFGFLFLPDRGHVPARRASGSACRTSPPCRSSYGGVPPARGARPVSAAVPYFVLVAGALRQRVRVEGVVRRQVQDGHRVVDAGLRERERVLPRAALLGLLRARRRVGDRRRPAMPRTLVMPIAMMRAIPRSLRRRRGSAKQEPHGRLIGAPAAPVVPRTSGLAQLRVLLRRTMLSISSYSSTVLDGLTLTGKSTAQLRQRRGRLGRVVEDAERAAADGRGRGRDEVVGPHHPAACTSMPTTR